MDGRLAGLVDQIAVDQLDPRAAQDARFLHAPHIGGAEPVSDGFGAFRRGRFHGSGEGNTGVVGAKPFLGLSIRPKLGVIVDSSKPAELVLNRGR